MGRDLLIVVLVFCFSFSFFLCLCLLSIFRFIPLLDSLPSPFTLWYFLA